MALTKRVVLQNDIQPKLETQLFEQVKNMRNMHIILTKDLTRVCSITTTHLYNICTMLSQRQRRWDDAVQMLYTCFVFAGMFVKQSWLLS